MLVGAGNRWAGGVRDVKVVMRAFRRMCPTFRATYPEFCSAMRLPEEDETSRLRFLRFMDVVSDKVSTLEVVGGLLVICKGTSREKIGGAWCPLERLKFADAPARRRVPHSLRT